MSALTPPGARATTPPRHLLDAFGPRPLAPSGAPMRLAGRPPEPPHMGHILDTPDAPHPPPAPSPTPASPAPGDGPLGAVTVADPAPEADRLRHVLEAYARSLETRITLHVPPSHHRSPRAPTGLHVHCFAVPRRPVLLGVWPRVPLVRLPLAFGYPLAAGGARGFAPGEPFGRGRVLADPDGRTAVELAGANLYILMDLLAQGDLAAILLRRCLDLGLAALPALPRISPLPADARAAALATLARGTAEAEATWRARARGEGRRRLDAEVDARRRDETHRLEREIDRLEAALEAHGRRITTDTRALAGLRRRFAALRDLPAEPAGRRAEFDRIRDLPEVVHVDVQDGALAIITRPLEADCGGQRYRLGAFRVEIQFEGDVRIANLTDRRGPYEHPHVRQGRPCLGNVREGVAKLIGELEFAAAAQVLLDFLQTVNAQDWRIPVFYWPRVKP